MRLSWNEIRAAPRTSRASGLTPLYERGENAELLQRVLRDPECDGARWPVTKSGSSFSTILTDDARRCFVTGQTASGTEVASGRSLEAAREQAGSYFDGPEGARAPFATSFSATSRRSSSSIADEGVRRCAGFSLAGCFPSTSTSSGSSLASRSCTFRDQDPVNIEAVVEDWSGHLHDAPEGSRTSRGD